MNRRQLAALLASVLAPVALSAATAAPAGAAQARPNVIVVMTDDQTVAQLNRRSMPATLTALGDQGTTFTNSFVSSPLCCPSRAGFLSGSYAHNNGVFDNEPGYAALAAPEQTLFTWLREAGYRTGHAGRFLLGYYDEPQTDGGALAPPGVDDWFGYVEETTQYYNGRFSDNGYVTRAGFDPQHSYSTELINRAAGDFVAESAPSEQPFFLWLAQLAPHTVNSQRLDACGGGTPVAEPGTFERFAHEPLPKPPSFNEKRISDKPRWVAAHRRLSPERRTLLRLGWRCALASLRSVDRGVAQLVEQLEALGELDQTAIFFTSDNGLLFGEHRLVQAKSYPYDEVLRVPLLARMPPAFIPEPQPREVALPVTNLDLSATVLDLANAPPCSAGVCHSIDGRSLLPLLAGDDRGWPKRRGSLVELGNHTCARDPSADTGLANFYDAIRTPRFLYVELQHANKETGLCDREEWELYNLRRDPHQLENIAVNPRVRKPSRVQRDLAARLARLRSCAGIEGRDGPLPGRTLCE